MQSSKLKAIFELVWAFLVSYSNVIHCSLFFKDNNPEAYIISFLYRVNFAFEVFCEKVKLISFLVDKNSDKL
jgi:hypothetical protein